MFKVNFKKNIFFKRIFSIKNAIIAFSFASFIDILLILKISSIFSDIAQSQLEKNFISYTKYTIVI